MRKKVKIDELVVYALFVAIFKPYFIPTKLQQIIKCILILLTVLYIICNGEAKEVFNGSVFLCASIMLSGLINYSKGMLMLSSLFDSVLYAICVYCIYTVLGIVTRRDNKNVVPSLLKITSLYCILSIFDLFLPHSSDSTGLILYFWGTKFTSSYLFLMLITLFYIKYNNKINKSMRWKYASIILIIISMAYAIAVECTTTLISIAILLVLVLLGNRIKPLLMNTKVLVISMMLSVAFPFVASAIMKTSIAQRILVELLGESRGLSGRLLLYDEYLIPIIRKSPIIGYGYGTTAMLTYTGFFGNTQNGLLEHIFRFGIVGAFFLIVLTIRSFKNSAGKNDNYGAALLVYSIIVAGTVEVTYGWFFIYGFSLVRWLGNNKNQLHDIIYFEG